MADVTDETDLAAQSEVTTKLWLRSQSPACASGKRAAFAGQAVLVVVESWSSRTFRDGGGASGRMKHPAAEQLEPGAAVHGAHDRHQPADLPLAQARRPP